MVNLSPFRRRAAAVSLGLLADRLWGEPPLDPHPVALFGSAMNSVETVVRARLGADGRERAAGVVHLGAGLGLGAATGASMPTAAATYLSVAGRALGEAAMAVAAALDADDLAGARGLLPALVGRDPSALEAKEIARAAVESVAENTVDALVAPALWALAAGGAGALGYRAVNTLDAMVGHRSPRYERYGWASARTDDFANLVPSRLTAALVAGVRPTRARAVWSLVHDQAPAHPSPNAGVVEAAFAAALDLRLGGENRYGPRVEIRPALGHGRPAESADIGRAVKLSRHVSTALAVLLMAPGAWSSARVWGDRRRR